MGVRALDGVMVEAEEGGRTPNHGVQINEQPQNPQVAKTIFSGGARGKLTRDSGIDRRADQALAFLPLAGFFASGGGSGATSSAAGSGAVS